MELKLLEDYLALVEHHSFTRAAEARHVTQPAFSRRIRALETWLGADLVDRNAYPTRLTDIGREFAVEAGDLVRRINNIRGRIRDRQADSRTLVLATQHSLSVSFVPGWLTTVEPGLNRNRIRMNASNLHDNVEQFLAGQSDLLLCYHSPDVSPELIRDDVLATQIGEDSLIPVCAAGTDGAPGLRRPGNEPTRLLSYPGNSFLGRVLDREQVTARSGCVFRSVCESALAMGLKAMALEGSGVAWLPASLVTQELAAGTLVSLAPALPEVKLRIMLHRHRTPREPSVAALWDYVTQIKP